MGEQAATHHHLLQQQEAAAHRLHPAKLPAEPFGRLRAEWLLAQPALRAPRLLLARGDAHDGKRLAMAAEIIAQAPAHHRGVELGSPVHRPP